MLYSQELYEFHPGRNVQRILRLGSLQVRTVSGGAVSLALVIILEVSTSYIIG